MGHSKIYNNDSKYVIANVMDDVENVNARELEKPRDFDPFGQAGLSPLATI